MLNGATLWKTQCLQEFVLFLPSRTCHTRVQKDDSGRPRGFGFVSFDAPTSAQALVLTRGWTDCAHVSMMSQCGIIASDMSDAPIKFHIAVYGFSSIQAAIAGMCGARNLYIYIVSTHRALIQVPACWSSIPRHGFPVEGKWLKAKINYFSSSKHGHFWILGTFSWSLNCCRFNWKKEMSSRLSRRDIAA